jgi:hypothetical protein
VIPLAVNARATLRRCPNVPPRVKQLLEGRTLASQTAGLPDLVVRNGRLAVQLPGKTDVVYALPSR